MRFPNFWQRNFLFFEGLIGAIVAVLTIVYGYCLDGNQAIDSILGDNRGTIYSALASIFASLFGFVIAATSIVLGLSGNSRLTLVRESESYRDLWETLFSAIRWLGVATLFALAALIFDRQGSPTLWIVHAIVVLTVLVVVRLWRCVWILQKTINLVTKPSRASSNTPDADEESGPRKRTARR